MNRFLLSTAVGLALALAGYATRAQQGGDDQAPAELSDDQFVAKAAVGGSTEVALARLAADRATSPEVKDFARRMITDHTAANDQLLTLAGRKRISVPRTVDAEHQEAVNRLAKLSGEEFDKAYARQMVKDHETTVKLFEREASDGRDADLKSLASRLLPTLKQHWKMARELAGDKDEATGRTSGESAGREGNPK